MKKFTFKGVLDGFRSSVQQAPRGTEQEIQETLRSDHFQIKKVSFIALRRASAQGLAVMARRQQAGGGGSPHRAVFIKVRTRASDASLACHAMLSNC
ncbi:hypothetical protein JYU34_017369 [Plutella xylostella]|uniref:Uncharacterized protein n=1 Tax=Plutella xylostella TaxID=51655 RepID=A0ABQ7Q0Z8_PLUXY|nr:hypothetical protein JYU34_017369 [Plutella xylostella]